MKPELFLSPQRLLDVYTPLARLRASDTELTPENIAAAIADNIKEAVDEAQKSADAYAAWEQKFAAFNLTDYAPSPFGFGDPDGANRETVDYNATLDATIARKIGSNKALIEAIGGTLLAAGSAYLSGGVTLPALVQQLVGVGVKIKEALDA